MAGVNRNYTCNQRPFWFVLAHAAMPMDMNQSKDGQNFLTFDYSVVYLQQQLQARGLLKF